MAVRVRLVLAALVGAVSLVATAGPAYAPAAQVCTACTFKQRTYAVSWSSQSQAFEIATRLRFDRAVAGDAAGWALRITTDVAGATRLGPLEVPIRVEGSRHGLHDNDSVVIVAALGWDRNGGTASGSFALAGTTELVNPAGRTTDAHDWVLRVEAVG